jgi:hypothetical protein
MEASVAKRRSDVNDNQGKAVRWEIREFLTGVLAGVLTAMARAPVALKIACLALTNRVTTIL